ncbi:hypothetical protein HD806DRAFT_540123 [Xylariaceae sp. AK1471]|nr:hypothetical protein HD806DRAFT_540123 [Xylariaceae sp. AK1471]
METLRTSLAETLTRSNTRLIYTTTATTAIIAFLAYSRHCYLEWHALGEGGVPRTPLGWLINVAAHLIARSDHRAVPAPYEKKPTTTSTGITKSGSDTITLSASDEEKYGAYSRTSFFSPDLAFASKSKPKLGSGSEDGTGILPPHGPRPTVPTTVLPQRQTSQTASPSTVTKENAYLRSLASLNPHVFAIKPSALESPKFEALWLRDPDSNNPNGENKSEVDPSLVKYSSPRARCEIAHVHPEGSTHVTLSLVDAAEVVRRGWGERHKLSGAKGILPWGYVLVYAPREDSNDWDVWREIVLASARVIAKSAGFDGEVVVPE